MDKNQIIDYLKQDEKLKNKKMKFIQPLEGGITNDNHLFKIDEKYYVLRLPTESSKKMIDRLMEIKNNEIGCKLGLNAPCIYFDKNTGIKIAEFIDKKDIGLEAFKTDENIIKKVAKTIRKLHNSNLRMENDFKIFEKLKLYEDITKENNGEFPDNYQEVKDRVKAVYYDIEKNIGFENKISHNDTLAENFILSKDDNMYLIDWEYAGNNDQAWDLTSFLIEGELSKNSMDVFLSEYFDEDEIDRDIIEKIKFFLIYQDFLWSVWTLVKLSSNEEGYEDYFKKRYNRAIKNLDIYFNEKEKGLEYYLRG